MTSITMGQCIKGAWKDGILAIIERPVFTLVIFALLLCIANLQIDLRLKAVVLAQQGLSGAAHQGRLLQSGCTLLSVLVTCGLSIHVFRFSLGETKATGLQWLVDGTLWRYFGLSLAMGLLILLPIVLIVGGVIGIAMLTHVHAIKGPMVCTLLIMGGFMIFALARLSLLFCHIALGRRGKWRAAWGDTRGHFWAIFCTQLLAALPLYAVGGAVAIAGTALHALTKGDSSSSTSWLALGQALWTLITISVGVASSAWLYRRFATTLLDAY